MADNNKSVDRKLSSLSRFGVRGGRGRGTAPPSRLPSLKPERDLTLGGTPKRTFTPNIVSRSLKKEGDIKGEDNPRNRRNYGPRGGRTRGRGGRGRGRGDIIASASIFSQGPAAQQTLAKALSGGGYAGGGFGGGGGGSGGKDDGQSSSRAAIKSTKGDIEDLDSDKIFELTKEEGKIELDEDDVKSGSLVPITLPLASKLMQKIKQEDTKTESELSQDEEEEPKVKDIKKPIHKKQDSALPTVDIADLLKPDAPNGQLFFLQLPDALPIQSLSHEDDIKQDPGIAGSENPKTVPTSEVGDIEGHLKKFTFQNVSEGYIGKLQIHQSGKVTMRLGNVVLNVSLGTPCGFLQDLVSIHTEKDPPEMVCLGHVNHRLIAVPDYESLLGGNTDDTDEEGDS